MNSEKFTIEDDASCRVLAVDDNALSLKLLVTMLERGNYIVKSATNGKDALDLLRNDAEKFDIILLDRMMPGIDGIEVTKRMKSDPNLKDIPIIMQTAATKPEEINEGIEAGVFYYLLKPLDQKKLLSIIASARNKNQLQKSRHAEMDCNKMSFDLIKINKSVFQTIEEAEILASFLANCFPDPKRAVNGLSELMINAVEHGNIGISYADKSTLIAQGNWQQTVEHKRKEPEHRNKKVTVVFERKVDACYVQISDDGDGFKWKKYLEMDASRAMHNHGRGIAIANTLCFDQVLYSTKGNQVTVVMQNKQGGKDDYWE
jgi:CheY-like chemotaxis protein/anti-sigma regulatory factor (Ser/Thr protein kinase)